MVCGESQCCMPGRPKGLNPALVSMPYLDPKIYDGGSLESA